MNTPVTIPPLSAYRGDGVYDEMLEAPGTPREHWAHLAEAVDELGLEELLHRRDEAARLLDQDGVVYNTYKNDDGGRASSLAGGWRLDPLPTVLSSREWQAIEAAVIERAELLNLVLDDLYGPRDLIRRGLLPAEVVFGHHGFLRACAGVRLPGQQLFSYAADLGRDADGRWCVLSDRTQTPSGFGYALENRTVVSRVLPTLYRDARVHRLAPFFRALRGALQAAAPPGVDDPRIVVLTPGPFNETAFEHAVLSSTLGYPLVEGRDLVVRGGGVWMGTLGRLEPVHVILRRVDGWYCDPLELLPDSQLGVAGLVEATRRGAVSVVNTLGSSALENPALMCFLPRIGEHLLGRAPRLPGVTTWWCGDERDRATVLERLHELVIRRISRGAGAHAIRGWELSEQEGRELRARIAAQPTLWVGQEPLPLATTPTLTDGGLEARRGVLRTFAVASRDSYIMMPGGLTRVAPDQGLGRITNQSGAISKDTWVLASEPERQVGLWLQPGPAIEGIDPMASLSARAAENLWWLGRYAERAEAAVRLLRAVHDRRNEFQGGGDPAGEAALRALLMALTQVTATAPGFVGPGSDERLADPGPELRSLIVDEQRAGTVAHAVRALLQCAYAVRDQLSGDTWLVVGALDRQILALRRRGRASAPDVQPTLQRLMQALLALGGLGEESMVRDLGWRFLDAGRRLERAVQLLWLLRATLTESRDVAADGLVLESTLTAAESIITYRRRYRSRAQVETALELLLLDDRNPRSLAYQLERLTEDLASLRGGPGARLREDQRFVLQASTALALADPGAVLAEVEEGRRLALDQLLADLLTPLLDAAEAVDRAHFVHRLPQRRLSPQPPV